MPRSARRTGSFTFTAAAKPTTVAAGEPVTLTMEIRGSGNVESLAAPAVAPDERFRIYEPKLITIAVNNNACTNGSLVWPGV